MRAYARKYTISVFLKIWEIENDQLTLGRPQMIPVLPSPTEVDPPDLGNFGEHPVGLLILNSEGGTLVFQNS